ncbi:MAG: MoxR family ATPase [Acidobacteria bacterium]|nr:MoxR family ATPase [Acidobacteriota bacterium]
MTYKKLFAPDDVVRLAPEGAGQPGVGDQREGSVYVYSPEVVLAVNVALATRRPLLVRGPSGSGKSSLARNVAKVLKWRYYETVISSRTQARDLLWEVDLLRRLHAAQAQGVELGADLTPYVTPGVLWWAFDRKGALRHGEAVRKAAGAAQQAPKEPGEQEYPAARAVVLIDEIDKADPDVPNNLLVPLGSLQFRVEETGALVETEGKRAPLVFITTNDERELPAAFLRRCVEIILPQPSEDRLVQIGQAHFPKTKVSFLRDIAKQVTESAQATDRTGAPSAAEYLDTVRACVGLKVKPTSDAWKDVARMTLWKHGRSAGGES